MYRILGSLIIFAALFISKPAHALSLDISYGKENNKNYSTIHITHDAPIACYEETSNKDGQILDESLGDSPTIFCEVEGTPAASFHPSQTLFFSFKNRSISKNKKRYFVVEIHSKFKQKLFATLPDLKDGKPLTRERAKHSKSWQIIGYIDEIPFLSNKKSTGLNFPINLISSKDLYLGELDLNRAPLSYEQGQDFTYFVATKKLMDTKNYIEAIKNIDDTLRIFPDTIFAKDLILYRIRALQAIEGEGANNSDLIIDTALKWLRNYPTDSHVPEVLYIIGGSYDDINFSEEARHYYERVFSEHPDSHYAPLARMALAEALTRLNSGTTLIRRLYSQAYRDAKDVESASQIAVSWAKFNLKQKRVDEAAKLLDAVYAVRPDYFAKNVALNYKEILDFANGELPVIAARFGEELLKNIDESNMLYAELFDNIGEWYEKGGDLENAHRMNLAYLEKFENRPSVSRVQARDDALLFGIAESSKEDAEKIKHYDYLIERYAGSEEAARAMELKAEVLLAANKFDELFSMTKKGLSSASPSLVKGYKSRIAAALKDGDCKSVALLYIDYKQDNKAPVEVEDSLKLSLFDCLFGNSLNTFAAEIRPDLSAQDEVFKLAWTYRFAKNHYALGQLKEAAVASRDALTLARALAKKGMAREAKEHYDIAFILFKTLKPTSEEALKIYQFLRENLADRFEMFEVNLSLLKAAESAKNLAGVEIYAQDIFRLQKVHKEPIASPYVDFALSQMLLENKQLQKSKTTLENLLKKDISTEDKQKALYLKGSLELALKESKNAKESFKKCENLKADSAWKNLCVQGLKIL